jgi:hypothetical protein
MEQALSKGMDFKKARETLPPKLRGADDAESKGFIHHSIVERLSAIVQVVPGCEDVVQQLKSGAFAVSQVDADDGGPDWTRYIDDELKESGSANCLKVSWFFLENYMYRYILGVSCLLEMEGASA